MKKKVVWLVVTGWLVAALLLASCAPAVVEKEVEEVALPKEKEEVVVPQEVVVPKAETNLVKWTGKKLDSTVVEKMLEKPKYGGVHITARPDQPTVWDDIPRIGTTFWNANPTNETLINREWTQGPAGTGEWSTQHMGNPYNEFEVGILAESWELIREADADTMVFHIRKGVRFQNKPPVNGREMTAADVVFSIRRSYELSYQQLTYRYLLYGMDKAGIEKSVYVSPDDPWAVVIKNKPGTWGQQTRGISHSAMLHIQAPEAIGTDYKKPNTDWKNVVGTGPFILKDYVGASALTYVRNPDYWMRDPFFPQNQLPYLDGLKVLIIPDISTRQAALRTGQIDTQYAGEGFRWETAESLLKTNPKLEWVSYLGASEGINMRVDKPELPWSDIRVRRALMMAVDKRAILNDYYGGKGELFHYPVAPLPEFMPFYQPLEKTSELVQELYGYHPDKARQMLAEAGYPQGFKAEVLAWSTEQVDVLSIIKEDWAKIGVDLKLDVRDFTVYTSMSSARSYTQMRAGGSGGTSLALMANLKTAGTSNYGMFSDANVDELYRQIGLDYDNIAIGKLYTTPGAIVPNKSMVDYINEQSWNIVLPAPYVYILWQPWLKNYYGTIYIGSNDWLTYARWAWIDQELKQAMGR